MNVAADRPSAISAARQLVLSQATGSGRSRARALSEATDRSLVELFGATVGPDDASHVALVAIGGYGRGELAPGSDLDVVLLHDGRLRTIEELASSLWYPLWDAGLRLGHGVRTVKEQLSLCKDDLHSATAVLSVRHLAGERSLAGDLAHDARRRWGGHAGSNLDALAEADAARHRRAGEVAYLLEPDVKEGVGGLRDVDSLMWASAAGLDLLDSDHQTIVSAADRLLTVRFALHQVTGRHSDVLHLEVQDGVAATMGGVVDADGLMADVAAAGRSVAWVYEQSWGGHRRSRRRRRHQDAHVAPGVHLADGCVELTAAADPADDPTLVLAVAIAAARREVPIGRATLDRLVGEMPSWTGRYPSRWPAGALDRLVALLLEGHRAIPVLETLDQVGLLVRIMPEWEAVRSKPQRNAYHRFTVDRHLWEAAANAAELVDEVARPDLLVLAALFHDLGKGSSGDHTDAGIELFRAIGPRIGLPADDTDVVVNLIRCHLLLPDVAVRRDLDDPATIGRVAHEVRTVAELETLHALTVADSTATGPTAWSHWKQELVAQLVERVRHVLGGGDVDPVRWRLFPDADALAAMASRQQEVRVDGDRVTVVTDDRPGTFARVAGALSLCGVDVLSARAHSESTDDTGRGMAVSQFRFLPPETPDFDAIGATIERALVGELALDARLAARARSTRRRRRRQADPPAPPSMRFLDGASDDATVIEVRAPTVVGLLYRLAKALGDVGLDIRHATVQTVGVQAVDTFYVRTARGMPVVDPLHRGEIERAVLHASGGVPDRQ